MNAPKTTSKPTPINPIDGAQKQKQQSGGNNVISLIAPVVCLLLGYTIWRFYLGNPSGFTNPDLSGGFWPKHSGAHGIHGMYEGGIIVPVLITLFLLVLTFIIERFFTIAKAQGKGRSEAFIRNIQKLLDKKDYSGAKKACDIQRGSVANVMRAGILKYEQMLTNDSLSHEQKINAIKGEIEESTSLELPILERNLVFFSTIASVATLVGLFGTVLGMIRAFSSLGEEGGAGAAAELAVGISEALYNTALGIGTSAIAIILYNVFTTKIDAIVYGIDESGLMLAQSFDEHGK